MKSFKIGWITAYFSSPDTIAHDARKNFMVEKFSFNVGLLYLRT